MNNNRKNFCAWCSGWPACRQPPHGVCNQSQSSQAERDLWDEHGCWQDFFLWQYLAYDVREGNWNNRGYFDACNVNLEYEALECVIPDHLQAE